MAAAFPFVNDRPAVPDTMTADTTPVAGNGHGFDSEPLVALFVPASAVRATAAGLMSPVEHLREALNALGVDETLNALAEMAETSTAAAATTIKVEIVT